MVLTITIFFLSIKRQLLSFFLHYRRSNDNCYHFSYTIDDQTTIAIIFLTLSTIKRQLLSFFLHYRRSNDNCYHFSYTIDDQTTIAIIFLIITIFYRRSTVNYYQCNIETISNSRDYYSDLINWNYRI